MSDASTHPPLTDDESGAFRYLQALFEGGTGDAPALMRVVYEGKPHAAVVAVGPPGEDGMIPSYPVALLVTADLYEKLDPGDELERVNG